MACIRMCSEAEASTTYPGAGKPRTNMGKHYGVGIRFVLKYAGWLIDRPRRSATGVLK